MRTSRTRSWRAFKPPEGNIATAATSVAVRTVVSAERSVRILGLDPGSRHTGFGIIDCHRGEARHVSSGAISTLGTDFPQRLQQIFVRVRTLVLEYRPAEVAIERVFVNKNVDSALKLGQARGAALCAVFAAVADGAAMPQIHEYAPREIKRSVVGSGAADKQQVQHMIKALLQLSGRLNADAADALAVALCHVHGRGMRELMSGSISTAAFRGRK